MVSVVRPSDGESVGSPGVAAHAAQARADGAAAQTSGRHRHEALGHLNQQIKRSFGNWRLLSSNCFFVFF